MIALFIDTSTSNLTVALFKDDILIKEKTVSSSEHSKYAINLIEEIFTYSGIDKRKVDKIMVINGPGSFTGIRIGVTIAKVYAWACNINVIPISTLKAYSLSYSNYNYYAPFIDARRGYVYGAIYDKDYNIILNDQYILYDDFKKEVDKYNNIKIISDNKIDVKKIYDYYKDNNGINAHGLLPIYLKKTEAEEKFGDYND